MEELCSINKSSEKRKLEMDFINYSHPSQTRLVALKRQAHSSAARATHARRKAQAQSLTVRHKDATTTTANGSPVTLLGAGRKDPFSSAATSFSPHDDFLLDQYITSVVPYLKIHCGAFQSAKESQVKSNFVQLALANGLFLSGIFMLTSRFLSLRHQRNEYNEMAIQYKVACIVAVRAALAPDGLPESSTLAVALLLATDEIMNHDLSMAANHVRGALSMLQLLGGPQALGSNTFIHRMLDKYILQNKLLDPNPSAPCGSDFMIPESSPKLVY